MKNVLLSALLFSLILGACKRKRNSNEMLWSMIKSNNKDSIIDATIEIQDTKNAAMINALLYQSFDPRITHRMRYNGMSVYQIKMLSLEIVTGTKAPKIITYTPDSSIVSFYLQFEKK